MTPSIIITNPTKADCTFAVGKSLLIRGDEEQGRKLIEAAARAGSKNALLFVGADLVEKNDLTRGLATLMKAVGLFPKDITYRSAKTNVVESLMKYADVNSVYAQALRSSPEEESKDEGACLTLSTVGLLQNMNHKYAARAVSNVTRLMDRITDFTGTKNGICAVMSDGTMAPLDVIPAAIKATISYSKYAALHKDRAAVAPILNTATPRQPETGSRYDGFIVPKR